MMAARLRAPAKSGTYRPVNPAYRFAHAGYG
jgi:hypothetical protein